MKAEDLTRSQLNGIVFFRILIGWHFMYEGIIKLFDSAWTSKGYLMAAEGPFSGFFNMLGSGSMVGLIDNINVFGMLIVGITLIFGIWERIGTIFGIVLLLMFYLSRPPFPGLSEAGTEGSYWIVNKNLIEAAGLWILYQFPTGAYFGIRRLQNKSS